MRIASLEIQRNTYGFTTTILGRPGVPPDQVVGQVKLKGDDGAELTHPLTDAQIAAALAAIADTAAQQARALGAAVVPGMFQLPQPVEHAELPLASLDGHAPAESDAPVDPLVIEAGKHYRTRDGLQVVEVTEVWDGADVGGGPLPYPVRGKLLGGSGDSGSWTRAGCYYSDIESDNDLVAEIQPGEVVPVNALA